MSSVFENARQGALIDDSDRIAREIAHPEYDRFVPFYQRLKVDIRKLGKDLGIAAQRARVLRADRDRADGDKNANADETEAARAALEDFLNTVDVCLENAVAQRVAGASALRARVDRIDLDTDNYRAAAHAALTLFPLFAEHPNREDFGLDDELIAEGREAADTLLRERNEADNAGTITSVRTGELHATLATIRDLLHQISAARTAVAKRFKLDIPGFDLGLILGGHGRSPATPDPEPDPSDDSGL